MQIIHRKGPQREEAFTLIQLMVVVAILALLAVIAITNTLRARITANNVMAQAALKTISTAVELYSLSSGSYPLSTSNLVTATPPYLNRDYFAGTYSGFTFSSTLTASSYTIVATPAVMGRTGSTTYTITTGGVLQGN